MIIVNFTHPLTEGQVNQLQALTGNAVEHIIETLPNFDHDRPFAEQVAALVDGLGLTATQWQTTSLLVVPPAFNFIAVTLLAELHGRMGCFPPVVRLRPVAGSTPTRYEVAEVINLQQVRDDARGMRSDEAPS